MEIKKGNWYVCTEGVSLEGQNVTYKKGNITSVRQLQMKF